MTEKLLAPRADDLVRSVGRKIIEGGLGRGMSTFDPSRPAWSSGTVADLYRRYNENLDLGAGQFLSKLHGQLAGAPDDTILFVAELLTLQALPLMNLTRAKKRQRIAEVLGWMSAPAAVPPEVEAAFAEGTWNGGQGAHTLLWRWLLNAVEFVRDFQSEPEVVRLSSLADPWAWQRIVHDHTVYPSLRESLKYLAFPSHFLPIINVQHKTAIRSAFRDRLTHAPGDNLDRDLFEITRAVQSESDGPIDYYRAPFQEAWRPSTPPPVGRHAWLVRPRQGGSTLVERWRTEGFVSLTGAFLGDVSQGNELPTIRAAVDAGYQHLDYAQRDALANEYYSFLSKMDESDIIATVSNGLLLLGAITGDAMYEPDAEGEQLRRAVEWLPAPAGRADSLPVALTSLLDQQGSVVDLTSASALLEGLMSRDVAPGQRRGDGEKLLAGTPVLRPATPELATSLHMGLGWLQEFVDLLAERQQIILFGPPGTGKTFLAQAVARHVAERDAVRLVQFHPSYAYEDFFEGFRPQETAGASAPGFVKTAGPLRELAAEARNNPGQPYVLIIDEINRANIAKVFGELYFLLEYRDASVRLQYSPATPFSLPRNVFIMGTMNTADRSIALVDAAIRRRFAFVELHPDEEPVRDVLPRWLAARGDSGERARLLRAVNDAIGDGEHDRDFKLGPSYFMRPDLDKDGRLERVWQHDILPTLEEHYFGRLTRKQVHERFALDAIRARLSVAPTSAES